MLGRNGCAALSSVIEPAPSRSAIVRAMPSPARKVRPPLDASGGSVAAGECAAVLDALGRLGIDRDLVFARSGLSPGMLDEPYARIPLAYETALWAAAERVSDDPAIGLRVGVERAHHGTPNVLDYIKVNSLTWRQAYVRLQGLVTLVDNRARMELVEEGDHATLKVLRDGPLRARGFMDALFATTITTARTFIADVRVIRVSFRHPRPADLRPYRALFPGSELEFSMPASALTFERLVIDLPMRGVDPSLGALLCDHAAQLLEKQRDRDPFLDGARRILGHELERGHVSAERLARLLRISARSLRRKLAERGTTYQALLDEMRVDLSCQLLRCTDDSIDAIAERLGFSDRSGFQRAFRRYTGQSPSAYRTLSAYGRHN